MHNKPINGIIYIISLFEGKMIDIDIDEFTNCLIENSTGKEVNTFFETVKIIKNKDDWSFDWNKACLLYTSPSPRDLSTSRMPSSA